MTIRWTEPHHHRTAVSLGVAAALLALAPKAAGQQSPEPQPAGDPETPNQQPAAEENAAPDARAPTDSGGPPPAYRGPPYPSHTAAPAYPPPAQDLTVGAAPAQDAQETDSVPLNAGLFPYANVNAYFERPRNNVSIDLWVGYGYQLCGAAFAGLVGVYSDQVCGAQGAGVAALALADLKGAQAAGIFALTGGSLDGFQGAGIAAVTAGDLTGFQGAGAASVAVGDLAGVQGAGIASVLVGDLTGLQGAGLVAVTIGNAEGAQLSGIANYSQQLEGLQGGLVNVSQRLEGAQIGLVNVGTEVNGTQIGLVNVAKRMEGAPIGIINVVVEDGRQNIDVWTSDTSAMAFGAKLGVEHVYGIIGVGLMPTDEGPLITPTAGIGGHVNLDPMFLNIEGLFGQFHEVDDWDGDTGMAQVRVLAGYEFTDFFSIFAGPTFNTFYSASGRRLEDVSYLPALTSHTWDGDKRLDFGIGFAAGIQML